MTAYHEAVEETGLYHDNNISKKDTYVHMDISYGVGVHPPMYEVDILGEPSLDSQQIKELIAHT